MEWHSKKRFSLVAISMFLVFGFNMNGILAGEPKLKEKKIFYSKYWLCTDAGCRHDI